MAQPTVEQIQEMDKLSAELFPSIQFDFSSQIENAMNDYWWYNKEVGRKVPVRQYMWDLFAVTQIMHITEHFSKHFKDYPIDKWSSMDEDKVIKLAHKALDDIITGHHDTKLISEEQEDISTYEYTSSQKLLKILESCYMCAIAYMKIRGYEDKFIVPEKPEEDKDGNVDDKSTE